MDDDNEVLTKGFFRAVLADSLDNFARIINQGFTADMADFREDVMLAIKALSQRLDAVEKELRGMHQKFDAIGSELSAISSSRSRGRRASVS